MAYKCGNCGEGICITNFGPRCEAGSNWEKTTDHQILSNEEIEKIKKDAVDIYLNELSEIGIKASRAAELFKKGIESMLKTSDFMEGTKKMNDLAKCDKEPELMTLVEALLGRSGEDLLQWKDQGPVKLENNKLICTVTGILFDITPDRVIGKHWQIIPAEPVVFKDANEAHKNSKFAKHWRTGNQMLAFKDGFDCGDLNGQRRRDEDYLELRDAVWKLMDQYKDNYEGIIKKVFDAYSNLKPLEG